MAERKQGKKKWINVILIALILLLSAGIIKLVFFTDRKDTADNNQQTSEEKITEAEVTEEEREEITEGSETFAIFGVDSRSDQIGKGTRSDSIMVANINHETKQIKVASIYRDTYVDIDGHGLDKITHAHSFGGPELAIDTLNRNFDLDIDKYITVNFGNVAEVINDIGGIDLDITSEELKYINGYIDEINRVNETDSAHITETGTQHVDGTQAVAYSRIRYTAGGDYKRAERQRTVLLKLFEEAKKQSNIKLIGIANKMLKEIGTNYSSDEVFDVLYYLSKYNLEETKAFPNRLWGGKVDGIWYAVPVTLESNVTEFHKYLFPDEEYEPSDQVKDISNRIRQVVSEPNEELD